MRQQEFQQFSANFLDRTVCMGCIWPIAIVAHFAVLCLSMCALGTPIFHAKMAKLIKILQKGQSCVGPKKQVLDVGAY